MDFVEIRFFDSPKRSPVAGVVSAWVCGVKMHSTRTAVLLSGDAPNMVSNVEAKGIANAKSVPEGEVRFLCSQRIFSQHVSLSTIFHKEGGQ